ncbi:FecR domain-containing protein [Spirosoma sp. BT702]|uniref:FecR domain-containing protein n=1 Tax=Spirosoma profusum TaxID=2771354 RepID=A0A926XTX1_9BACT|nr:FecR family protein [Spirosoma profusum]MBD2700072.1 FecR domain-containing protein [Spirosoma profusum]
MSRKSFKELLQKYLRGDCTPEEKAFVEHWYGLLETESGETGQQLDMDELEDRLWNRIQDKMDTAEEDESTRIIPLRTVLFRWVGVAASLVLVGWWYFAQRPDATLLPSLAKSIPAPFTQEGWIEKTNESANSVAVQLEDGSTVKLDAHSSLRYPKHFAADKRTVFLTGDAFFDVARMPSRPFYVYAGNVVTKVLGTSFFVRNQQNTKQVRVEVVTGRVAIYEEGAEEKTTSNGVVLSPNQAATFFEEQQHFVTGLVEAPQVIKTPEAEKKSVSFEFDDTPLVDVLTRLEQAYGINIEVESESQNNCPLTADLTNQPLYTQLDIICAALKSTYEVQGTTILVSGKGCGD